MKRYGQDKVWPFAEGGEGTIGVVTAVATLFLLLHRRFNNGFTKALFLLSSGIWLLILYFFRDPNRQTDAKPGLVVSPADGEIVAIIRERENRYLNADTIRISIFLSVTNVHVQRSPLNGRVTLVDHQPGKFLQAFRPEASDINEYIAMIIDTPYGPLLVKQIAGILARRCVNPMQIGDTLQTGQRFGLIRFGSRVDIFLPPNAQLLARIGDTVHGGLTPLAQLQE
ncbi:MAG: phosphatidylserine decarboxylase family protein [Anaerolineales bacterium]|nr:phosphatidylserine decarboxylase family protein [Anaerolineales bacterium]MCB8991951.1 phosphatidylserine decarboxylase family protein [Ardenticatenaceae bacterium]MCB9004761.1 phosphatidylserine decarboxylase family protein [Ardenticatenaceae bacterium]